MGQFTDETFHSSDVVIEELCMSTAELSQFQLGNGPLVTLCLYMNFSISLWMADI